MLDWNVIVTVREHQYKHALRLLADCGGEVEKTDFLNVLVVKVEDSLGFLAALHAVAEAPRCLGRVVPVDKTFYFQSPQEFEDRSRAAVQSWVDDIAGKTFHVRMHRRGFKGRLSSQHEEQFLDHFLLQCLEKKGQGAHVGFDDPDVIIAVETLGQRAGLSLWTREARQRYPLLKLD
ncbi:THUMP domain-containing protein [Thiohalobacter sp. IOR34]|uniref:THUMP domain-containing protein n=1 Tax=Thiohalobacter sp. IOR34 TaxID=3057176 RepID=UPI0025B0220A|nr:THUMP domain-containing protein [Thiohalobacter sp. IOR34]WJW76408.1 THUMP domain-containing protein [Thiohalobacter sp. IOR34]